MLHNFDLQFQTNNSTLHIGKVVAKSGLIVKTQ